MMENAFVLVDKLNKDPGRKIMIDADTRSHFIDIFFEAIKDKDVLALFIDRVEDLTIPEFSEKCKKVIHEIRKSKIYINENSLKKLTAEELKDEIIAIDEYFKDDKITSNDIYKI